MSNSFLNNLLDEQIGLVEIKIQGLGELFLSNDFIPMVEYARQKHLWVRSTTNTYYINKKEDAI